MRIRTRRRHRRALDTLDDALARLGLLPDLGYGRVCYQDEHGRRVIATVYATATGVVLVRPDNRIMRFTRLEAGHCRRALKVAALIGDPARGVRVDRLAADIGWQLAA